MTPNNITTTVPHKKFEIKKILEKICLATYLATVLIMLTSCMSAPSHKYIAVSRNLTDKGVLTSTQLAQFFRENNSEISYFKIKKFAKIYIREAAMENINSDVAFAQMCLETGYLTYGNLVTPEMNNFCGLGAMDAAHPGEYFQTPQLGVRAHIQHLHAYATTAEVPLNNDLVDPRYNWVHKTKFAETVHDLAGNWATDKEYGNKLDNILYRMETLANN